MPKKTQSTSAASTQVKKIGVTLLLGSTQATFDVKATPAHGTGLDGKPVESLSVGDSSNPGKSIVIDVHKNAIETDANELFAAAQFLANKQGKKLVVETL